jgi:hypothetical protein
VVHVILPGFGNVKNRSGVTDQRMAFLRGHIAFARDPGGGFLELGQAWPQGENVCNLGRLEIAQQALNVNCAYCLVAPMLARGFLPATRQFPVNHLASAFGWVFL